MTNTILSVVNVTKTFKTKERTFTALNSVNLNIGQGEYLAIVGKSGSGKSTLLNVITGIDHPSEGCVKMNNIEIGQMDESKLAQWRGKNVGIVFQFFQLIPTLTISENLLLAMEFVNVIPKAERLKRVNDLLTQVDIHNHADKMPSALSGGEQQRAAIARALANSPEIIVADEPTGNLDSKTANSIHQLFKSLAKSGKTVIVITHEGNVESKYDRIITLSDGEIVSEKETL